MRRRDALKSMAALTAVVRAPEALFSQQPPAPAVTDEPAALPVSTPEEIAGPGLHFLTSGEMAAFRHLADILVPRTRTPGAVDAGAPEFVDFYLSQSDGRRQNLYRAGLARLNEGKPFTERAAGEIERLLAPLREQWSATPPADPLAAFLRAAKEDLLRATFSSRAWALASEGRRRATGGTYWYPVE